MATTLLQGPRSVLSIDDSAYPQSLRESPEPPPKLFVMGNVEALKPGLAVIGARRATPYGRSCASRFARLAAEKGVCIISGGARGCDGESHRAALACGGSTVAFLGGGCDHPYPKAHIPLFQEIVDKGGAVVSEQPWDMPPLPYMFRARNRLIAGLADAVLIVEAGLPSGTFSTADEALNAGKEILVVPGAITSASSRGSNQLLFQGAIPIIDDESFEEALFSTMGVLKHPKGRGEVGPPITPLIEALCAEPMHPEGIFELAMELYGEAKAREAMNEQIVEAESRGLIARFPDGRWGPTA